MLLMKYIAFEYKYLKQFALIVNTMSWRQLQTCTTLTCLINLNTNFILTCLTWKFETALTFVSQCVDINAKLLNRFPILVTKQKNYLCFVLFSNLILDAFINTV